LSPITHLSPNLLELDLLHSLLPSLPDDVQSASWDIVNAYNLLADFRAKVDSWTSRDGGKRAWMINEGVVQKAIGVLPFVENLWVKCGSLGLVRVHILPKGSGLSKDTRGEGELRHDLPDGRILRIRHYSSPEIKADEVVSTTGAGDTLVGGLVAGLVGSVGKGEKEEVWVERALERVVRTMKSHRAVG
jgi:pseudouridine-5'-phosphate glycosidase/pseudouridine kinase